MVVVICGLSISLVVVFIDIVCDGWCVVGYGYVLVGCYV